MGGLVTTIIKRSWLESMGGNPSPDLAYIISDHHGQRVVTWEDIHQERRRRQRQRLEQLRRGQQELRAYKLWVAYFNQDLMGGWHAFVDTYGTAWQGHAWIDRDRRWQQPLIVKAFPILLPLWPEHELWERWKVAFACRYARRRHHGEPLGVAYLWWDGRWDLRPAQGVLP